MSGIKDNKITDTTGYKVADTPGSSLSGTVLENKQVFDKLAELIITKYNAAIDYLYGKNIDSGVPNTVATTTANGLMSSSDKSKLNGIASGANNYTHPTYTARTGQPTANQTPAFGGSFNVTQFTSDTTGHINGATHRSITIPSATATTSAAGLMSASDKTKLNNIGATPGTAVNLSPTTSTKTYTATTDGYLRIDCGTGSSGKMRLNATLKYNGTRVGSIDVAISDGLDRSGIVFVKKGMVIEYSYSNWNAYSLTASAYFVPLN